MAPCTRAPCPMRAPARRSRRTCAQGGRAAPRSSAPKLEYRQKPGLLYTLQQGTECACVPRGVQNCSRSAYLDEIRHCRLRIEEQHGPVQLVSLRVPPDARARVLAEVLLAHRRVWEGAHVQLSLGERFLKRGFLCALGVARALGGGGGVLRRLQLADDNLELGVVDAVEVVECALAQRARLGEALQLERSGCAAPARFECRARGQRIKPKRRLRVSERAAPVLQHQMRGGAVAKEGRAQQIVARLLGQTVRVLVDGLPDVDLPSGS
eukprot:6202222-Pleurochrysis_carterae.AAC.4